MFEVKEVYYNINGNAFFKGISFFAKEGEITSILGESGAGKSTFLSICSGLLSPISGKIFIDGKEQADYSKNLVPGNPIVKIVNQKNDLFPNISLDENLRYKLRFYKNNYIDKRSNFFKKAFKIDHLSKRFPREVSGGELQRWQIACAIAEKPAVLLLDEPFSNLDPLNKLKMKDYLSSITKTENMTTILVSHDIQDSFGMAEKMYIMKNGKFIQNGNTLDIYQKPKNTYVSNLTGISNILNKNEAYSLLQVNKKVLIRPEWIRFCENGDFKAKINKTKYIPPYFQLHLNINEIELICFSGQDMNLEKDIKVNFDYYFL